MGTTSAAFQVNAQLPRVAEVQQKNEATDVATTIGGDIDRGAGGGIVRVLSRELTLDRLETARMFIAVIETGS